MLREVAIKTRRNGTNRLIGKNPNLGAHARSIAKGKYGSLGEVPPGIRMGVNGLRDEAQVFDQLAQPILRDPVVVVGPRSSTSEANAVSF